MKMTKTSMSVIGSVAAMAVVAGIVCAQDDGWQSLFNGKDLTGWTQKGGKAEYKVEGDSIVGTTVTDTPNSFLCTDKLYENFILEYEFKCDPKLNSGVQIRSESTPEYKNGRVHGYQIEIDVDTARGRLWTAGVYDEGRRGWLFPGIDGGKGDEFSAQGIRVTKADDWNLVRVEARGPWIKTWLNGELRADLHDEMTPKGFIALQVHSIGKRTDKLQVRWRNIRIQELPADAGN